MDLTKLQHTHERKPHKAWCIGWPIIYFLELKKSNKE